MIPVPLTAEPHDFETRVRSRGEVFLASAARPITNKLWRKHSYWTSAHDHLYAHYNGICMYCASWTPRASTANFDSTSLDHFLSKEKSPSLAYEWSNLRLSRRALNSRKGSHEDVIDPFKVPVGAFVFDFPRNRILADSSQPKDVKAYVESTIQRLQLNIDPDYLAERFNVCLDYANGRLPWQEVVLRYPFIAHEMSRQDFDAKLAALFR